MVARWCSTRFLPSICCSSASTSCFQLASVSAVVMWFAGRIGRVDSRFRSCGNVDGCGGSVLYFGRCVEM